MLKETMKVKDQDFHHI